MEHAPIQDSVQSAVALLLEGLEFELQCVDPPLSRSTAQKSHVPPHTPQLL